MSDARARRRPLLLRLRELQRTLESVNRPCPVCDEGLPEDIARCSCFDHEIPSSTDLLEIVTAVLDTGEELVEELMQITRLSKGRMEAETRTAIRVALGLEEQP